MRWTPGGSSDDVEDRRDESGGGGFRAGGIHLGLGGVVILFILSIIFKRDFLSLVSNGSMETGTTVSQPDTRARRAGKAAGRFRHLRPERHPEHLEPGPAAARRSLPPRQAGSVPRRLRLRLRHRAIRHRPVLLSRGRKGLHRSRLLRRTQTALRRSRTIRRSLRPGPRNWTPRPETSRHRSPRCARRNNKIRSDANELSVRLELQADCFAGVWGHSTQEAQPA